MIIKRLKLHNFGVYAGTNEFIFTNSKPIILIGGLNGRGKTTFLEAVLLALYGANSIAYIESNYKSYGTYLNSYINRNDNSLYTFIELEFQIHSRQDSKYLVRREWSGSSARTKEQIYVEQNGQKNDFLLENWPMFIENLLPSALAGFFFFDGEKIAEIAVDNTNKKIKESIRSMLGITVLDTLQNDLRRVLNRAKKTQNTNEELDELQSLRKEKEHAEIKLRNCDQSIEEITNKISEIDGKLEQKKIEYLSKGGEVANKRNEYLQMKTSYDLKIIQGKEAMMELASNSLPLCLVKSLLLNIQKVAEDEYENRTINKALIKIQSLFNEYNETKNKTEIKKFIDFMSNSIEKNKKSIFELTDRSLFQLKNLLENILNQSVSDMNRLIAEQDIFQKKIKQIENQISIDINNEELNKLSRELEYLNNKKINYEIKLNNMKAIRSELNGNFIKITSVFNKFASSVLDSLELNDDTDRIIKYASMATQIAQKYSINLQREKIGKLAETITTCYKSLSNKKTLINSIEMNTDTLELSYLTSDGKEIDKEKLSAGEKQLMVISILWALAKCSKKKLPVIIDTPLSRLDSAHRKSLIKTYFPNASEQTIILSTDTEIDRDYYKLMKKNIGDEYYLAYDEKTKSTTVRKGYFL
jgi:DNA sulfur modification protein dndD